MNCGKLILIVLGCDVGGFAFLQDVPYVSSAVLQMVFVGVLLREHRQKLGRDRGPLQAPLLGSPSLQSRSTGPAAHWLEYGRPRKE